MCKCKPPGIFQARILTSLEQRQCANCSTTIDHGKRHYFLSAKWPGYQFNACRLCLSCQCYERLVIELLYGNLSYKCLKSLDIYLPPAYTRDCLGRSHPLMLEWFGEPAPETTPSRREILEQAGQAPLPL